MNTLAAGPADRRRFLQTLSAAVLASRAQDAAAQNPLRGLFPIGYSPFTDGDQLDLDRLAAQVRFLNKGRVHGLIWPQIASEWTTLSKKERFEGAEAITAAGKGGKTAIVIGVQGPDMPTVLEYVKHAEKSGADAICSLPPAGVKDDEPVFEYYKQLGSATGLPLFVQSQPFPMSVDLLARMCREIPNFRQIKDEAGDTMARITEIRDKTGGAVTVFTGNGVRNMITELMLGAQGFCPYADVADVYAQVFDLWQAGKRAEAFDMFGRVLCFTSVVQGAAAPLKYVLVARGVLKNTRRRSGSGGGGRGAEKAFAAQGEKLVRDALDLLKPCLRA